MAEDEKKGVGDLPPVVLDHDKIKPATTPAEALRALGVARTHLVPTPRDAGAAQVGQDIFVDFFEKPGSAAPEEAIKAPPLAQPEPKQTGAEVDEVREAIGAVVEPIGLEPDEYLEASGFPLGSPDVKLLKQMFDAQTLVWLIQEKRIEIDEEQRVVKLDVSFRDEFGNEEERWVKRDIIDADGDNFQNIGQLTRLQRLNISRAVTPESQQYPEKRTVNLNFLRNLPELEELIAVNCYSEDFSPLKDHKKLKRLDLLNTNLPDLEFLLELAGKEETPDLENLNIGLTAVNDFSPLWICAHLKRLNLDYTNGQDITTVGLLQELESLYLYSTGGGWVEEFKKDKDAPKDGEYHPSLHPHREKLIQDGQIDQVINKLPQLIFMIAPDGTRLDGEKLILRKQKAASLPGGDDSAVISLKPRLPTTLPGFPGVTTPRPTGPFPGTRTPGGRPLTLSTGPSVTTTPTVRGESRAESARTPSGINALVLTGVLVALGLGGVYYFSPEFRERVQRILEWSPMRTAEPPQPEVKVTATASPRGKGERKKRPLRTRHEKAKATAKRPAPKPAVAAKPSPPQPELEKSETPPPSFQDTFTINVHWGESIDVEVKGGEQCDDFQLEKTELINSNSRIKITIRVKKGGRSYIGATYIEKNNDDSDDIAVTRQIRLTPEAATKKPGEIEGKPAGRDQEEDGDEFEDEVTDEESEE